MRFITVFLLVLILSSCGSEEENEACILGEPDELVTSINCSDLTTVPTGFIFCDLIQQQTSFLNPSSKVFLPQWCLEENSVLTFVNNTGAEIDFRLSSKVHKIQRQVIVSNEETCTNSQFFGICKDLERASFELVSSDENITFIISLKAEQSLLSDKFSDNLTIYRETAPGETSSELIHIVDKKEIEYDVHPLSLFFAEIEIAGKVFQDIISWDISLFPFPAYQHFYSLEDGLIGFIDVDGVEWRLK